MKETKQLKHEMEVEDVAAETRYCPLAQVGADTVQAPALVKTDPVVLLQSEQR